MFEGADGERCGALSVACADAAEAALVLGQMKATVRRNYSSPGLHAMHTALQPGRDAGCLLSHRGMFSYTGPSAAQVDRLRDEFGVYLVRSGRMCVAGLNGGIVERTAAAMAAVRQ